jgi:DNA gyrase/topoisomerase IV subunit B
VLESIVKVQGEFINRGENSRIQALLSQTVANIESSVNGIITQETGTILQEFKNNFETIVNKFAELKEIIEEQGNKVIASLKNEIRARDEQLKTLVEGKN